jgi:hypothetical protein
VKEVISSCPGKRWLFRALVCAWALALAAPMARGQFPMYSFIKYVLGPGGKPHAHVGDVVTTVIRYRNLDEFLDSHIVTNIFDVIHHASGDVQTSNLLAGRMSLAAVGNGNGVGASPKLVVPGVLLNFGQSVNTTSTCVVLPGDGPLLLDDAVAGGIDNHDGVGGTYILQHFLVSFPGQIQILAPALDLTQACAITGPPGTRQFISSGVVSNSGQFNTTLTNVILTSDRGTPATTNDDTAVVIGALNTQQTFMFSNAWAVTSGRITHTLVLRGTDAAGLTVWATNRCLAQVIVPVAAPAIVRPGHLRLKWSSRIGTAYQIETRPRLDTNAWASAGFIITATGTTTVVDVPTSGEMAFFRVVEAD